MRSFEGYVESFILSNKEHVLATDVVTDFRSLEDVLFNVSFQKSEIVIGPDLVSVDGFVNKGTEVDIIMKSAEEFKWIFFEVPNGQSKKGTFD